jgi:type II secretory pathway pseudopilin PulG
MQHEGRSSVASLRDTIRVPRLRAIRDEAGFTLIEALLAGVMLAILSAPISALLSSSAVIARLDRERTGADQIAQSQIEMIRTLSYTQVGVTNGNPPGVLAASTAAALPSGEAVTIKTQVTWVSDPIPTAYVTNADYKKVVLTVTRTSDGKQLAQKSTFVASASAPPLAGTSWVQIKRQVIDAVTTLPLPGANVNLTGGPDSENRNDTTDGSGTVIFPALTSATNGTPVFTLATTFSGYAVFPDDISPGSASSITSAPGTNSTGTLRMYLPVSLTINVQTAAGAPYTSGATVSLDSSRCGLGTVSIPSGQSSTTITSCNYATGKSVPLVPNVLGQTPLFDKYYATAWSNSGGFWGVGPAVTVPSSYPATLTQSVNVKFSATTYPTTKQVKVTVTKGGPADTNARVEVTGGPAGVDLYGTTDANGQVTLTVPVTSTSTSFTVNANDMGVAKGTTTFSASTGSSSPINTSVTVS